MNLTPTAKALRTEIIARPEMLFTVPPSRRLTAAEPVVDAWGDAAHLIARLRDEVPADVDRALAQIVASLPPHTLEELGVTVDALTAALRASRPAVGVYV